MASAFNVSGLLAYASQNSDQYLSSLITGAKTIDIIRREGTIQTGIKTTDTINMIDVDATWQEGNGCGFSALGATTFSNRTITVGNIKINLEWCMDDLIGFAIQEKMRKGSIGNLEELPQPLESAILNRLIDRQNRNMERAVWQGDTASGDDKLQHFDGFIKILTGGGALWTNTTAGTGTATVTAGGTAVTGSGTAFTTEAPVGSRIYTTGGAYVGTVSAVGSNTGLTLAAGAATALAGAAFRVLSVANAAASTTGNINARMDALYGGVPVEVLNQANTRMFIGEDEARTHQRYMIGANLFNYQADANWITDGYTLPGTSVRVTPTPGLNGTGLKFVIDPANMIFGTDLENEWEQFKIWFSDDTEMLRLKARWRAGVQVAFPAEVTASY